MTDEKYKVREDIDPRINDVWAKTAILYKKSSSGKIRQWQGWVSTEDGVVYYESESGFRHGTLKQNKSQTEATKLLTPMDKAISKMKTALNKKLDDGYFDNVEDAENYEPSKPMLLHRWDKYSQKIMYPCLVQPKLDGVCAVYRDGPTPYFDSRENNSFEKLDFMAEAIRDYLDGLHGETRAKVNAHGELYAHGYKVSEIIEAIKGDNKEVLNQLKFYIFDYMPEHGLEGMTYRQRLGVGSEYYKWASIEKPYVPIRTLVAKDRDMVDEHYEVFLRQQFEGLVACNYMGTYAYETRSYDKLKKKNLFSEEFEICGIGHEMHGDDKAIMFTCRTDKGVKFTVRPAWDYPKRIKAYEDFKANKTTYLGEMGTVEYRSLTKYRTPFHGVLIEVRDYE